MTYRRGIFCIDKAASNLLKDYRRGRDQNLRPYLWVITVIVTTLCWNETYVLPDK